MSGRIVITGAGGQVGSFLNTEATRQGRDVLALTSQWDISDPRRAGEIVRAGDVVINCAAYTAINDAERDQDRAYAINAAGPEHMALACARVGARLVHISTDYVFDGEFGDGPPRPYEPGDATRPLSFYGQSKLSGEQAVLAALPQAVVVRTAWVYTGGNRKDCVAAMRRLAAGDGVVDMVDANQIQLTYIADLVEALLEVADGRVERAQRDRARGQRRRGHPLRANPRGIRNPGRRPGGVRPVSSDHNPRPATPAGLLGAVRSGVAERRSVAAAAVAGGTGDGARFCSRGECTAPTVTLNA